MTVNLILQDPFQWSPYGEDLPIAGGEFAPVDATTAKSSDEDVTEAQTDLTLLDPVHWSPCGKDLVKDVRELNCQGSTASFLTDEKGSVELKTWQLKR